MQASVSRNDNKQGQITKQCETINHDAQEGSDIFAFREHIKADKGDNSIQNIYCSVSHPLVSLSQIRHLWKGIQLILKLLSEKNYCRKKRKTLHACTFPFKVKFIKKYVQQQCLSSDEYNKQIHNCVCQIHTQDKCEWNRSNIYKRQIASVLISFLHLPIVDYLSVNMVNCISPV